MYAHFPALYGSIKSGGVKLVLWAQTFLNEIDAVMHVSKMSTLIDHPFVRHHSKLDTSVKYHRSNNSKV